MLWIEKTLLHGTPPANFTSTTVSSVTSIWRELVCYLKLFTSIEHCPVRKSICLIKVFAEAFNQGDSLPVSRHFIQHGPEDFKCGLTGIMLDEKHVLTLLHLSGETCNCLVNIRLRIMPVLTVDFLADNMVGQLPHVFHTSITTDDHGWSHESG